MRASRRDLAVAALLIVAASARADAPTPQTTAGRAVAAARRAVATEARHVATVEAAGRATAGTPSPLIGPPPPAATPTPTAARGVPARAVSAVPQLTPVPSATPAMAHLDDHASYAYNALGRRDPFQPLLGGLEYIDVDAPPDVGGLKVVGIVWGDTDKFALCEDGRGNSLVLRRGDKVMNGIVDGLKRDAVIVSLTVDGQSQTVTIPLTRKGDSNATH